MSKEKYNAVAYLRLSKEDKCEHESDSISNQRKLILDYVSRNEDIRLIEELVDDGYSGTNINRPAFQKMIRLITDGPVNCVIVKDLSRFSRNYMDAGKFLEVIFPSAGVRFIAINDNYDNINQSGNNLMIEFKNIINDIHARDISDKIKTSLNAKRKNGELVSATLPYGYIKSKTDKNQVLIDDNVKDIIRQIFAWRIDGYSGQAIVNKLNELKIVPPEEYKKTKCVKYPEKMEQSSEWVVHTVNRMFVNMMYAGDLIQGKTTKRIWNGKVVDKDEDEWDIKKNSHEAIIPRCILNATIRLSQRDLRSCSVNSRVQLFSGMAYCANCKESMAMKPGKYKNTVYPRYVCILKKKGSGCLTQDYIKEKTLYDFVLDEINTHIKKYPSYFDELRSGYFDILDEDNEQYYKEHGKIKHLTRRIIVLLIDKIYVYAKDKIEVVFTD